MSKQRTSNPKTKVFIAEEVRAVVVAKDERTARELILEQLRLQGEVQYNPNFVLTQLSLDFPEAIIMRRLVEITV